MPQAAAALPLILSIGSTIIGAAGQVIQGISASRAANYRARVAQMNQQIAQDNARRERFAGQIAAQDADFEARQLIDQLIAQQGASGITIGLGSAGMVLESTRRTARLNAKRIQQQAELKARDSEIDALQFGAQAGLAKSEARGALTSGIVGGLSSVLGGAARFSGTSFGQKKLQSVLKPRALTG